MKRIILCFMLIAAIAMLSGCGKDNNKLEENVKVEPTRSIEDENTKVEPAKSTEDGNTRVEPAQGIDEKNTQNSDGNEPNDEKGDGSDWRSQRSYTSDFQIKPDLTVCLARFDDGNGYAVYNSKDGSRIGSLVAELDGNELIVCADYDDDGIFELGFGGTPSGDIWYRYVDRPWSEGGCFEEHDFGQGAFDDSDFGDWGDTGTDDYDYGENDKASEFNTDLEAVDNIDFVDVVNMTALGVYVEDTHDPSNSRFFDYGGQEISIENMSEFDCAYLTLYTEDYGDSEICFTEAGINNIMLWNIEDGRLVTVVDGTEYYGDFYYDPESTVGCGLYICLHIDNYNVWLCDYALSE